MEQIQQVPTLTQSERFGMYGTIWKLEDILYIVQVHSARRSRSHNHQFHTQCLLEEHSFYL